MGFGDKGIQADGDLPHPPFFATGFKKGALDVFTQGDNGVDIRHGFKGQPDHEVEFQVGDTGGHQFCGGIQNILFREPLVDTGTHAFRSGIRGNGGGFDLTFFELGQKVVGKGIRPEGTEGNLRAVSGNVAAQRFEPRQIGDSRTDQSYPI